MEIVKSTIENVESCVDFLENISDNTYTTVSFGNSSIGSHIRHIIEYYESFFRDVTFLEINYDKRPRNKQIETNRLLAIKALKAIISNAGSLSSDNIKQNIFILESTNHQNPKKVISTPERELLFLFSHTTHHLAIIKLIAQNSNVNLMQNFGKAPSTIKWEEGIKVGA